MQKSRFVLTAAAIAAAVGVGLAASPSSSQATPTGPSYIAWGYNGDGTFTVLRSAGITDTYESVVAGGGYECIETDGTPTYVTTGDGSIAIISGDLANLGWDAQDAWFGAEGGYCPGAQVMVMLGGNGSAYAELHY